MEGDRYRSAMDADALAVHFFFLGAAFLLLEVQNVSKASVVFGNTWQVNAVVVSGSARDGYGRELAVAPNPEGGRVRMLYALLLGSCIGLYFVDLSWFASLPYVTKIVVVGGLTTLPMLFSGMIFVRSFTETAARDEALGANLGGALVGAMLQSLTFVTGIKALLLVVAALYGLSYAVLLTNRKAHLSLGPQ